MAKLVQFHTLDYLVCVVMLVISAAIGFYYRLTGGRQNTKLEYLLAGRSMGCVPVAFSLLASFMSAITLMGVTSEVYRFGTQFVLINIAYGLATPIAAHLFLPTFYHRQQYSVYQYLESRFGWTIRLLSSLTFTLMMILYTGIVLYAPAQALSAVSGLDLLFSLLTIGLVCTLYSSLGGMKAVLITDVFQTLLMFSAIFLVIVVGSRRVGGLSEVWRLAGDGGRLEFFNLSVSPLQRTTLWTQLVGGMSLYLSLYAVSQAQVQRLLSTSSLRCSQMALWLQWPLLTALSLSTALGGLVIYANYRQCDPLLAGAIAKPDQLLPYFVMDTVGSVPGLPGLFLAGIFSGSLSSVSSSVNSIATICIQDFIKPMSCCGRRLSVSRELCVTKLASYSLGVLFVLLAYAVAQWDSLLLQLSLALFGAVGGPLLAVFSLGMFTTSCNHVGAVCGLISGLLITLSLRLTPIFYPALSYPITPLQLSVDLCSNSTTPVVAVAAAVVAASSPPSTGIEEAWYGAVFSTSYMWLSVIGFGVTFTVGWLVSLCHRCCCCCSDTGAAPVAPHLLDPLLLSPAVVPLYRRLGWLPAAAAAAAADCRLPKVATHMEDGDFIDEDLDAELCTKL